MEKYNVYKISVDSFKAVKSLAENIDQTEATAFENLPCKEEEFISAYEVDSDRDLECKAELGFGKLKE